MSRARVNQISGGQLLCLLIMARLATLLLVRSLSYVQFLSELAVSAVLSLAVYLMYKYGVIKECKALQVLLIGVAAFCAVADVISFFDFTVKVAHPEVPVWIIAAALAAFSLYSGMLGTEAVARFSALAIIVVLICVAVAIQTNIADVKRSYFLCPQSENVNPFELLKCLDVPAIFLLLAPKTNEKQGRAILLGSVVPYTVSLAVIMMCRAVVGRTAHYYRSPVFALFQLGEAGAFNKLDVFYVCAVLLLIFTETSLAVSLAYGFAKGCVKK